MMAIQLGNDDESVEMSEINVTPLVDVMLVLLVVFIVTAPLLTQVVRVKLPKTEQTSPALDKHVAILSINALGKPELDGKPVALASLESELKVMQERDPDLSIQLQADKAAVFESVAKVMASAQRSGVGKLSFVTLEQ